MKGILMFRSFLFSFLLIAFTSSSAHAFMNGCAKDIFKVGASFDSLVVNAERESKELDLVSKEGLSIYFNWIIFCPKSGIEISPYFYSRNYTFESNDDFENPEDIESFTIGIDFSKTLSLFGFKFDGIIGVGYREDIILGFENGEIRQRDFDNTLLTFGIRKDLYTLFGAKGSLKAHMGLLFADDDRVDTGFTARASTDLHFKLAKKYALILDLFYDYYDQEEKDSDLRFSRKELGLGSHFLFRF
jgi:hypothetical protein